MTEASTVSLWPVVLLGVVLLATVMVAGVVAWLLMPPPQMPSRPLPRPPQFPPGRVGEFMAEEELRRMRDLEQRR